MTQESIKEELKRQVELLKKEKAEDLQQYKIKISGISLHERRNEGVCWYPLDVQKVTFDATEHLLIKVSRPIEHTENHSFQTGKLVSLFATDAQDEEKFSEHGVISALKENEMTITLNCDDVPDWVDEHKLGVQLLFDDLTYQEMQQAIQFVQDAKNHRVSTLKNILLGHQEAVFNPIKDLSIPSLNPSQLRAVQQVIAAKDVAIIHGPPGTGKTTTLVEAIVQSLQTEKQVLVCAPSNAAIDLLVEKLVQRNISTVRIGHPARVTEDVLTHTVDAQILKHADYKRLKDVRKKVDEFRKLAQKYKRHFGKEEREQRRLLYKEVSAYRREAQSLAHYIREDIIHSSQVVATTLVGANHPLLKGKEFKTVFIDEAAQAMEAACWIPIIKSERVVLAGDHHQLPPTIKSYEAAKQGLEVTLFEKAIERNEADTLLDTQYRMHEDIMRFSNQHFYQGALKADDSVAQKKLFKDDLSVEFIDTAGCGFFEKKDEQTGSTSNLEETDLLWKHLSQYVALLPSIENLSIGIISPYKSQVRLLQEQLASQKEIAQAFENRISINTVDSFQGQERDIIYISMVRCNDHGEIGFLKDTRRMNVAMTRAKCKLVMFGDSATIGGDAFYTELLDMTQAMGAYRSGFELMY